MAKLDLSDLINKLNFASATEAVATVTLSPEQVRYLNGLVTRYERLAMWEAHDAPLIK
jgi:hypothetical protein